MTDFKGPLPDPEVDPERKADPGQSPLAPGRSAAGRGPSVSVNGLQSRKALSVGGLRIGIRLGIGDRRRPPDRSSVVGIGRWPRDRSSASHPDRVSGRPTVSRTCCSSPRTVTWFARTRASTRRFDVTSPAQKPQVDDRMLVEGALERCYRGRLPSLVSTRLLDHLLLTSRVSSGLHDHPVSTPRVAIGLLGNRVERPSGVKTDCRAFRARHERSKSKCSAIRIRPAGSSGDCRTIRGRPGRLRSNSLAIPDERLDP